MIGILVLIVIALASYLLGSLNFGVILSRKLEHDDVREHGSGNAGTTNMLRNYGKKVAILTILGDMAKVGVAVLMTYGIIRISDNIFDVTSLSFFRYICDEGVGDFDLYIKLFAGLFCVLGHIFPCFFDFKGGKGVATSGGMVFIIDWRIALILLVAFFIVLLVTKYVSLGSLVMAVGFPILMQVFHQDIIATICSCVFTLIVVVAHRENVVKLIKGTESKINDKKTKK